MLVVKIIVEIVLGFITLTLGSGFWNCVKSPKFLGNVLEDYDELKKYYLYVGKDSITKDSDKIEQKVPFSVMIGLWIKASFSALDKTKYMLFLVITAIFVGSYFLMPLCLLINIVLFFLMAYPDISSSAKNNMMQDVRVMLVNIHKWNKINPQECKNFCTVEQPKMLKNIYRLTVES